MSATMHIHLIRQTVAIPAGDATLGAELSVPAQASGVVLFAHGSGSSRHSPRNRIVAAELHRVGIATLLPDLLTRTEEQSDLESGIFRFNVDLLAKRLVRATDWLTRQPETRQLPIGYLGASTGAAAALIAAVHRPRLIGAVVSRGGRPDLAGHALVAVRAPTLLIVGERDVEVLKLNREAMAQLRCEHELAVVPDATHLFEEPGALACVAHLARVWFDQHLVRNNAPVAQRACT